MDLKRASPYLQVVILVLVVILMFQVNTISNQLSGATVDTGDSGDSGSDTDTVPTEGSIADAETVEEIKTTVLDGGDPVRGDLDTAAVVIVEYSDFECPFCGSASPTIEALLDKYGEDIALVYKDFPLSFHANAQISAEAAECAHVQGMFWEYHDVLFANQGALDRDSLIGYATDLGLDVDSFTSCLDNGDMADEVAADYNDGVADGVRGTPAFFVNGVLISGAQPQSVFEAEIEKYL